MDCFVCNVSVDPSQLGIDLRDIDPEDDARAVVRGHLSVEEVVEATEGLFSRFIQDTLARDAFAPAHARILDLERLGPRPTDLRSQLSLGLRLFRKHLAREFLETVIGPARGSPRYTLCRLDELRGAGDRVVFSCTAHARNPEAEDVTA